MGSCQRPRSSAGQFKVLIPSAGAFVGQRAAGSSSSSVAVVRQRRQTEPLSRPPRTRPTSATTRYNADADALTEL